MARENLFEKSWLDLVFQGRNRDYGAYALRSAYGNRLTRAVSVIYLVASVLVASIFTLTYVTGCMVQRSMNELAEAAQMNPIDIEIEKKKHIVAEGRQATAAAAPEPGSPMPEIVSNEQALSNIVEEVLEKGPQQVAIGDATIVNITPDTLLRNDPDAPIVKNKELLESEVLAAPMFPGGWSELPKWIDKNLGYPASCLEQKIGGVVEVSFYVDTDGTVKDATIKKSAHPELDQAVLQLIGKMPRWRPRVVDGKATRCSVTIPIEFNANDNLEINLEEDAEP